MGFRVLVTSRSFGKISDEPIQILQQAGMEMVTHPRRGPLQKDELLSVIGDVDGLIVGTDPIDAEVLEKAPRLKAISKHGVGLDNIDLEAARRLNIQVANAPGTNVEAVAEMAVCFMLGLSRSVTKANQLVREGTWGTMSGLQLSNKTVGIIGLGAIGRKVVTLLAGFGVKVLAYDPYPNLDWAKEHGVELVALEELLTHSDYVSVHVPFTKETKDLLDRSKLTLMKKTAFLINLARGGVVNEGDLAEVLNQGAIAGAGIDVFSQEPPDMSNPLMQASNVIFTPHIGAHTVEAMNQMSVASARNVVQLLQGEHCPNLVK